MKIRLAVPALAVFLMAPAMWAQSSAAAPGKIGVINVQAAILSTAEGKQGMAELQSQFAPRQTELQNMQKQIEDITTRLRNGETTLSDDEKARLTRQGEQLQRTFQRKQQEMSDDGNEAQGELGNTIGHKLLDILNKYSKDNGFAVILNSSGDTNPILYALPQLDITQEIVHLYDQTYPVKSASQSKPAATTPKPAAPKPAAPKTPQQ